MRLAVLFHKYHRAAGAERAGVGQTPVPAIAYPRAGGEVEDERSARQA